jgi:transcriptional regulator with XRE-family HTH domain
MQSVGTAIKAIREAQGLSQRDLAKLAGVNAGYLSSVESGNVEPSQRWLAAVTNALGRNLAGVA